MDFEQIDLEKNAFSTTKTLVVLQTPQDDTFSCLTPHHQIILRSQNEMSWRRLRQYSTCWGSSVPTLFEQKIFMQQTWIEAVGWDEQVPDPVREDWRFWLGELSQIERIRISKCLKDSKVKSTSIHIFTDRRRTHMQRQSAYEMIQWQKSSVDNTNVLVANLKPRIRRYGHAGSGLYPYIYHKKQWAWLHC